MYNARQIYHEIGGCIVRRPKGKVLYRVVGYGWNKAAQGPSLKLKQMETGQIYDYIINKELLSMLVIELPRKKRSWRSCG